MTWLVTGGAGYIGAHIVHALRATGRDVVVVDDLSTGRLARIPDGVPAITGTLLDERVIDQVLAEHGVSAVVHLAAKKRVDESLREPSLYFRENLEALRQLLDKCVERGVSSFLFSSSAAVYGEPADVPVREDSPCVPTTPYGQTKLAGEWLTHAVGAAAGMRTMALRYFNVAGAASPELADTFAANLLPIVLGAIRRGEPPRIYGDDYPTPDGTCIRDYVHVADLAEAHVAAAAALESGDVESGQTFNVGTGRGVSVREMVDLALSISGSDVEPEVGPRRPGDSPMVVASVDRAAEQLRWTATRDVKDMIDSAWRALEREAG